MLNSHLILNDPTGHREVCGVLGGSCENGGAPSSDPDQGGRDDPGKDEDDPEDYTYHLHSDQNLYLLGWQNFSSAWSIWSNPNASMLQRMGSGYYLGIWGSAHLLLATGVTLLAYAAIVPGAAGCGINPQCEGEATQVTGQLVGEATERITTVIGRYPANKDLAESIGGNWLNTSMKVWNSMSPAEQWERNRQWLQEAVMRGDVLRLASRISEASAGSGFAKELNYLFSVGYTITGNGQYLLPPTP